MRAMSRTRRLLSLACLSLIVLSAIAALAQGDLPYAAAQGNSTATPIRQEQAGNIRFGVPVEGALDNTIYRQIWRFEASGGSVVDIRMQALSGDLDPFLVLISPLGDVLRTNDSASGGLDAGILAYQLPFNGEYRIVARRAGDGDGRGGRTSGTYRLTLDLRSPGTAAQNTVLFIGRTVEGRLTEEQPRAVYRLELGGALALRLDLDGANRLASVRLFNTSGALLGTYQGLSPLDIALNLPTERVTLVEVSAPSYEARTAADFALSVYRLAARPELPNTLQYGRMRYAESPSALQWFFIGTAGDVLSLSVQAETFSSALEVSVTVGIPNELPLFSGVLGIGLEQVFTLPATGAYSIELRAPSAQRFRYSVLLKQIGANNAPFARLATLRDQGAVTFNAPIEDNLPRGEVQSRWLDADADQVITVRAAPRANADTLGLAILRPDGTVLAASVSRAERGAVLQNVLLPQTGRYRIAVFELALQTERETPIGYTLRVEDTDGGTLRPAQPVKGVATRENGLSIWEITAAAESLINVRLENLTPVAWQPDLFVINPNGVVIAAAQGETSRAQALTIFGAHAAESGTYRVVVGGRVTGNFATYRLVSDVQQPFEEAATQAVQVAPLRGVAAPDRYAPTPTPAPIQLSVAAQISPLVNPAELPADQIAPLLFNSTVRGEIGSGSLVQAWRINSGSNVVIQLRATALDGANAPRLTLWDRNGRVIGEQFNAQGAVTVFTYRIRQGGNYTVVVSMGLSGGRYLLTLDSQPLVEALRVADGTPLTYGQTVMAELQNSLETDTYFFLGTLNDVIRVQAVRATGRLAPALSLIGPNGREIAADRPTDGRYYAELPSLRLPDSGLYRLVVSNLNRAERIEGRYTLSLGLLSATRLQSRGGGTIAEGETRSGFLLAGDNEDTWLFRARRGQRVSFAVFAAEPPSPAPLSLQLLDTSGQLFAAQTRTLAQNAIYLEDVLLPEDGVYRVRVVGGTQGQGVYRLEWLAADGRAGGVLGYGQTVSGILTAARNFETWVFSGNAGDVVSVAVRYTRGTPFTASFQLRAANGVPLATVADLEGIGARADVLLPFDGSYSIIVANPTFEFEGASVYALSLGLTESRARAMGSVLRYGQEALSALYADDGTDTWIFAAQAGERVRVTLQATDRFLAPYLELRSATDEVLASALPEALPLATARIGGAPENDFVIPADGAYALIVRGMIAEDGAPSTGGYRIRLDFTPRPVAEIDRLSYGSAVNGVLADDRPHEVYLFEGKQGDLITAQAIREPGASLSLTLQLLSADGQLLAQADSDDSDSVLLPNFRLPHTGEYRLVVSRFGNALGQTAGRYTVRLNGAREARPIRTQVRYGQQVLGRLNDAAPVDRLAFDGQRGDVIGITTRATSGDLDVVLRLEREDGSLLASNDDADGVNAALSGIQLPEDGRYVVVLTRVGTRTAGSAGNYELFVNLLYKNAAEQTASAQPIAYGTRLIGALDAQTPEVRYAFRGVRGDQIVVQMLHQNDDAPPILALRDPSDRLLASGALSVGQTDLQPFTLPADGLYQLVVRRPINSRARYSPFALTLDLVSLSAQTPNSLSGGILNAESSAIGEFTPSQTAHYWLLSGEAGQQLSLHLLSLSGENLPTAIVLSPDGQRLGETDARGRALSATLERLHLPQDGVYTLLVLPARIGTASSYRLTVQRAAPSAETPPRLTSGIAANGILDPIRTVGRWSFDAEAEQSLAARLLVTSGNLQPRLLLLDADGRVLAEGALLRTAEGISSLIVDYPIARAGTYFLQAERADVTTSGSYRLLIELGKPARLPSERALAALRIAYNQVVRGVISSPRETLWAFIGAAGDVVNISAVANTPSCGAPIPAPQLEIQDISGRLLAAAAPEALEARESAVQSLILPADGRYIVVMRAQKTVPYTLIVQRRQDALPSNLAAAAPRPLLPGLTLQNGITPGDGVDYWTFSGKVGEPIQIEAARLNGDLRLDLALYAPSGTYLIGNAAPPTLSAVALPPLRLPEDGTYLLVVTRWLGAAGQTNGAYRVRLTRPDDAQLPLENALSADDRPFAGFLSEARPAERWHFSGRADERYALAFERLTDALDARLQLLSADGQPLSEFDLRAALRAEFTLPSSGSYQLLVQRRAGQGAYRLRLQRLQSAEQTSIARAQGIAYEQTVQGDLRAQDAQAWLFFGRAADRIAAELLPLEGDLDGVTLSLLRPDGKPLAAAVRAAEGSRLADLVLPADGFYALAIRAERSAPLRYQLSLLRLQPSAHYQGELRLARAAERDLRPEQPLHEWRLRAERAEPIALRLRAERGAQNLRLFVVAMDGALIAEASAQDGALALDFLPQAGAPYAILVQRLSAAQGSYQLSAQLTNSPSGR